MARRIDEAMMLEAGLLVTGVAILGAAAALLGGRLAGESLCSRRGTEAPPAAGIVPAERHRHVGSVAAR